MVLRFETQVQTMQRIRVLDDTGYSHYMASLDVRPKRMSVAIMSYGLSGRGGPKDVEVSFTLCSGLGQCEYPV